MFSPEHYFASKSFAAVRETFSDAYPDKEVPIKKIHPLVTKFRWMLLFEKAVDVFGICFKAGLQGHPYQTKTKT
jgi:hypothetical protein